MADCAAICAAIGRFCVQGVLVEAFESRAVLPREVRDVQAVGPVDHPQFRHDGRGRIQITWNQPVGRNPGGLPRRGHHYRR
jgi:hypothetical protein